MDTDLLYLEPFQTDIGHPLANSVTNEAARSVQAGGQYVNYDPAKFVVTGVFNDGTVPEGADTEPAWLTFIKEHLRVVAALGVGALVVLVA
jgi:hypothetical protein